MQQPRLNRNAVYNPTTTITSIFEKAFNKVTLKQWKRICLNLSKNVAKRTVSYAKILKFLGLASFVSTHGKKSG